MLKLLRKDLILNWKMLAVTYGLWSLVFVVYPAVRSSGDGSYGLWSGSVAFACAFLPITMLGREDKFRAGALACSLPVTRNAIVASRYLGGWLVALTGVALAVAVMGALSLAGVRPLRPPTPMLPVAVVTVIGITTALMMPLPLRFGIAGLIGFLVIAQLVGVGLVLASALFGSSAIPVIESAVKDVISAVGLLHRTLGSATFSVVLVAAVVALNIASCCLSAWIYRTRDF